MAVIFLQRRLSTGISTLKQMTTLRKERLFLIFCLISFDALAGAWCGTSLLMGQLRGKNAPQGQPAAGLSSLWNTPGVWKGQAGEMQQLRDEVTYLAAEIRSMKKGLPSTCRNHPAPLHGSEGCFGPCLVNPLRIPLCSLMLPQGTAGLCNSLRAKC
ncbi:uncharacterized protein ACIB01_000505 [Guaruba guarouba]